MEASIFRNPYLTIPQELFLPFIFIIHYVDLTILNTFTKDLY